MKRVISLVLSMCMVLAMLPVSMYAEGELTPSGVELSTERDTNILQSDSKAVGSTELAGDITLPDMPVQSEPTGSENEQLPTDILPLEPNESVPLPEKSTEAPSEQNPAVSDEPSVPGLPEVSGEESLDVEMMSVTTVASGTCGTNATWILDDTGTLRVSGTGEVTTSADWASYRTSIKALIIEDGLSSIASNAFSNFTALTSLSIAGSVTSIGSCAFSNCSSLPNLFLPSGLEIIRYRAFENCSALQSVYIPASVTHLDTDVFCYCSAITAFIVDSANAEYCAADGVLMNEEQTILMAFPCGSAGTSFIVPDGVTQISQYAFYDAVNLQSVSLPASLASVSKYAFYGCDNLSSVNYAGTEVLWNTVNVDNGNSAILNAEFSYGTINTLSGSCGDNASYTFDLSTGMLTISGTGKATDRAWSRVSDRITSVTIGANVSYISWDLFSMDCLFLQSFTVESGNKAVYSQDGVLFAYNGTSPTLLCYPPAKTDSAYTIPSGTQQVAHAAFYHCTSLYELTIPASVWGINGAAFCYSGSLAAITVDDANTTYSADNGVLLENGKLFYYPAGKTETTYTIPHGTTSIQYAMFGNCAALTELKIPLTVVYLGLDTLTRFPNLQSIVYAGTEDNWNAMLDGENLTNYTNATVTFEDNAILTGKCGDDATYTLDLSTGELAVSGTGEVKYVGFANYGRVVRTLIIAEGITVIGNNAFSDLNNLTSLSIASTVTEIDSNAFNGCSSLTTLILPANVEQIGGCSFSDCHDLQFVYIPASVTYINSTAFINCTALTSFTVDSANEVYCAVGGALLDNEQTILVAYPCGSSNTSFTVPEGVTRISEHAFSYAGNLESVTLPVSLTTVEYGAFYSCDNLSSVSYAGTEALWNTVSVDDENDALLNAAFTFGEVSTVSGKCGDNAYFTFDQSTGALIISGTGAITDNPWNSFSESITSVTIGTGITDMDWYLFEGNYPLLQAFTAEGSRDPFYTQDGVLFGHNGKYPSLLRYPSAKEDTSYTVPENIRQIRSSAFYSCIYLQELTIPASVTSISRNAFDNSNALAAINVADDNTIYSSDNGVLLENGKLLHYPGGKTETVYTIPNGTTAIWYETFGKCNALTELTIPLTVTSLDVGVFKWLPNLQSIIYAGTEASWNALLGDDTLSEYTDATVTFENNTVMAGPCGDSAQYTLDLATGVLTVSGTGEVEWVNFGEYSTAIQTLIIEEGITSIGSDAFCELKNITSLSIPSTVTYIGGYAFAGCSSLSSLVLPASLETIEDEAFAGCSSLQSVYIPASVTYLASNAFYDCSSLTAFTVDSANEEYCAVGGALMDADQSVLIAYPCGNPNSSYAVPEGIEQIESYAFYGAVGLQSISLPASLTTIGYAAFIDCDNLSSVTYAGTETLWNTVDVEKENDPLLDAAFTFGTVSIVSGSCGTNAYFNFDPSTGALTIFGTGEATKSAWSNYTDSITTVTIGAQVADISWNLFSSDYPNLQSFTVESGNKEVHSQNGVLFAYNGDWPTLLRYPSAKEGSSYTIPADTRQIRSSAFNGCALSELALPASCSARGNYFTDCLSLRSFTVYGKAEDKSDYLFAEDGILYRFVSDSDSDRIRLVSCPKNKFTSGTAFVISDGVSELDSYAFAYCSNLTEITIPNSISTISSYAFYYCSDLKTANLPSSVTQIYDRAFYSGKKSSLTDVYYAGSENMWENISISSGNTALNSATIHYGGDTAYSGTLDGGKVSWMLDSTTGLLTVTGNGNMDGDSVWANMSCLKKVVVEEGITTVDLYMLDGCSVEELVIPASVTRINSISSSMPCLKTVTVAEENQDYCAIDNVLYSKDKKTLYRFPCVSEQTTYAIPGTVTTIAEFAFSNCTKLTEITIPDSVTWIGYGAFQNCTGLTSIMVPESVTHFGGSAVFYNCTSLETVTIVGPLTAIYSNTFGNCSALTHVSLPGSVARIDYGVFYDCSALETITFAGEEWMWEKVSVDEGNDSLDNATVTCTGLGTFTGTCGPNLTWTLVGSTGELTISGTGDMYDYDSSGNNFSIASPTDLIVYSSEDTGVAWHKYAKAVRKVTVGKGVTSIGGYAFYGCSALSDVGLPAGLTEIDSYAFYDCSSLETIHIPASVTYIGSTAFSNCTALTAITVDSANKHYCTVDGILMNAEQTMLLCYPGGRENTSYTVPGGVSCIGDYAFYAVTKLESISLPASLTEICYVAFGDCDGLTSVSYAGTEALWDTISIAKRNDPLLDAQFTYGTENTMSGSCGEGTFWSFNVDTGTLTITGNGAIENLPWPIQYIRTVIIGAGITGIHHRTSSYPLLESVTVEAGNSYLYSIDGVLYEGNALLRYPAQKQGTTFNVPENVDTIDFGSFNDCAYLQQVHIPAAVQQIDAYAFSRSSALTQITVATGNEVYTSIDGVLLENGKLLYYPGGKTATSYAIPSGTTSLDSEQFGHCTALTELHIPFSVGYLYPDAFRNMPNLERIVYEGSTATWDALLEDWDLEDYTDAEVVCTNTAVITGTCGTNLTWTLDSSTGTLTISGVGSLYGYDEWNAPWNSHRNMIFSIVVEEGVNSIGQSSFAHCRNATSISIPKTVTFVGQGAFAGCDSLPGFTVSPENTAFAVNDGILFSADGKTLVAFPGGYAEKTYTVPNSVTQIGGYAFKNCDGLKAITIPNTVTQIGEGAFQQCSALTSMSLPNSVTTINYATFANCNSLTTVSIPETVTSIGGWAFRNCNNLSSIELPSGITSIGGSAFFYCSQLTDITLPAALTTIGDSAFEDSGLRSLDIPDSVTEIGSRAFAWSSLQTISLPSEIEEIQYSTFYGCRLLTSITIPDKVTIIEQQAFDGCTALTSVTIPLSLSEVYWDAFDGCSALATVTYAGTANDWTNIYFNTGNEPLLRAYLATNPLSGSCGDDLTWNLDSSGVLTISGEGAMDDFGDPGAPWHGYHVIIRSIVVEEGVTSICQNAFWDCSAVDSIQLPKSLTDIGSGAFADCTSLTGFSLADGNPAYQVNDGILFSADGKTLLRFPSGHSATSYTIPNSVTAISYAAFNSCTGLKAVAIPETVTSIDTAAFEHCSSLSDVNIPSGVTVINNATFRNCYNLTDIDLPDSITSIGQSAFAGCYKLSDIQIPSGVTHIGGSAFSNCEALKTIDLPEGLDIINLHAFFGCSSLSSITIPGKVSVIDFSAFENCDNLTSVRIEEGITTISNWAFANCQKLQEIHLPTTLTVIGSYAFYKCSALETVHFAGTEALWDIIEIQKKNDALLNAEIIFGNKAVLNGPCGDNLTWAVDLSTGVLTVSGTGDMDENWEHRPWSLYEDLVTHIVVEDGVTSIAEHAFQSFNNLTSVSLPNSLTHIGDYAFNSCSNLTTVNIPASVTHIGNHTFSSCSAMTSYTVAADNPSYCSIGGVLFTRDGATLLHFPIANGLTAYAVPDTVEVIAEDAFSYNRSLTTVTLPEGLKQIGNGAFWGCSKLSTVNIPASVTSIDYSAFYWCFSLTGIYVADGNPSYYDDDGILFQRGAADRSPVQGVQVVSSWGDLKLYVPDETETVASDILLVYPSARTAKEYTVPDNVGSIDYSAFHGCPALKKVYLGANLVEGHSLFRMCGGLTAIEVDEENPVFYSIDGVLYRRWNDTQSELLCYPAAKADTAFIIPDNVTYAILNDPTYLTSLTVPISMQHLVDAPRNATIYYAGSETMWEAVTRGQMYDSVICSGTAKVFSGTFGDSGIWTFDPQTETLTLSGSGDTGDFQPYYAGDGSGVNCPPWYRLEYRHVVVEEGITRLGDFIFDEIHWFESISLPSTLTALGEYLKGVWWSEYTKMEIPAGITELCGNTFGNIKDITLSPNNTAFILEDGVLFTADRKTLVACYRTDTGTYAVPKGVETIGAYAFYNSSLNGIILPDSITTIEEYAFYGCENLSELTLPGNVVSVGIGALLKSGLEELTVENSLMRPDAYWFVTELGSTKLQTIYFSGTEAQWFAASADLSDYYPGVKVICTGNTEELQYSFDADSNTLHLSGTEAGTSTVMVAFYDKFGQMVLVKMYTAAEVNSGVTITDEAVAFAQHTITIFLLDEHYAPVSEAIPVNISSDG